MIGCCDNIGISDRDNSLRYEGASRWFDFWNVRVVLPNQRLFFFIMPFVLSGTDACTVRKGLYVYDGGNGGPAIGCRTAMEEIGTEGWSASSSKCDVRWSRFGAPDNRFAEDHVCVVGPTTRWDVRITPFLADEQNPVLDKRQAELRQWMLLRKFPFIHRVPRVKGYAAGTIEHNGRCYSFERAPLYQAKNHGHAFPDDWLWIHANAFVEDEHLGLEAARLRTADGMEASMVRVARPEGTRLLCSWRGDEVEVESAGDKYRFHAQSKDLSFCISGTAVHGESVRFTFPSPDGSYFDNDECLVGVLEANVQGVSVSTTLAALGRSHRAERLSFNETLTAASASG